MKKLAIICGSLSRGGAERVTICLAEYMTQRGVPTVIITGGRGTAEYDSPEHVQRISLSDGIESEENGVKQIIHRIRHLRKAILEQKIDTVLIMGVPVCLYAVPGCLGTDAKIIVSERNDPRHFSGKKIVKLAATALMWLADGFVFQTEDAKAYYKTLLQNQGAVIPNPLLADNLPPVHTGEREKVIVSAGRLVPQKNQMLLVEAFAQLAKDYPEYALVIYGEGPVRQTLEEKISQQKLQDRVHLPGNVQDLPQRIRTASAFVMTSDFEGMPNSLIEAMALGLPCISTDCPCGGPKSLLTDKVDGLLFPVGSRQDLVLALKSLLDDPDSAQKMGLLAARVRERLHVDRIGSQWLNYLNEIAGK